MTTLADVIKTRIAQTGPITVADYMTDCLMHPTLGYYTTQHPFGVGGDFTTAPEISQMFGELIGLCLAQAWIDQGQPTPFILAELGPGRGTLMADMLRATRTVPGFHATCAVHLVETSSQLRASQKKLVPNATWHDSVDTLPDAPLFVVANEFFDALPIRQFVRAGAGWRERMVGITDGSLSFGLSSTVPLENLRDRLIDTNDDDLVETCPALPGIVGRLSHQIDQCGGAAILIDYGDWQSLGDTLQALQNHQPIDPLAAPGLADLTAHVDFAAIAKHAAPARHSKLTTQGVFLERLGITQRAQSLACKLSGSALESHVQAHRRLTHPSEMGDLFKVLGIFPKSAPPLPGLTP